MASLARNTSREPKIVSLKLRAPSFGLQNYSTDKKSFSNELRQLRKGSRQSVTYNRKGVSECGHRCPSCQCHRPSGSLFSLFMLWLHYRGESKASAHRWDKHCRTLSPGAFPDRHLFLASILAIEKSSQLFVFPLAWSNNGQVASVLWKKVLRYAFMHDNPTGNMSLPKKWVRSPGKPSLCVPSNVKRLSRQSVSSVDILLAHYEQYMSMKSWTYNSAPWKHLRRTNG